MKKIIAGLLVVASVLMAGCPERKGPLERAGERADEIGDNIKEGDAPLKKKGPLEKAGEAVDESLDDRR